MNNQIMRKFVEGAGRIGRQRHLVAIRNGFIAIMPLIIVGSLAILVNNFPRLGIFDFVQWMNSIFGVGNWKQVGGSIWNGTFAVTGLLVAFTIAYNLAKSYNIDGLAAALISASSYIMLVPLTDDFGLDMNWLGTQGLFVGIIVALGTTELFKLLSSNQKLTIKMPEGVPTGVLKSFNALIPATIILILVGLLQALLSVFAEISIFELIFYAIQKPLQGVGDSLPGAIVVAIITHILWFFGLHGTNITGAITEPIYITLVEENLNLFQRGMSAYDVPNIVTKPFLDTFVFMGGSGATISLLIAIFIVVRREKKHLYREVAKVSAPASLFNINEPIVFSLPIVLNPVMLIPFVLVPVTLTVITYFAMYTGMVPKTITLLPWTTPPIISGYLVTGGSLKGIVLQLVNLTVATCIYIPFVIAGVRAMRQRMGE